MKATLQTCSKVTVETLERRHCCRSDFSVIYFEQIKDIVLMYLFLTWNIYLVAGHIVKDSGRFEKHWLFTCVCLGLYLLFIFVFIKLFIIVIEIFTMWHQQYYSGMAFKTFINLLKESRTKPSSVKFIVMLYLIII